ncbi:site-specific integrase [Tateyamaria pelophila]|uniref:site-specific integrase n=1 Tax=Tateyamaria pelophila TaxID=328415 RepID=UPI001CBC61F1|nr:site-specific integrase [Tateyamaria pelophila]
MKLRLTDLAVRKLSLPDSGQITHWDETTPGFGVRCSPKNKSYVIMYGVKRRLKTLGRHPVLSLSEARKRAKQFQATQSSANTITLDYDYKSVLDAYLADCNHRLRDSTFEGYLLYFRKITFDGSIKNISRGDVLKKIQAYSSRASSQNHAFTTFKVFFNWCVRRQYLDVNPLGALKRPHKPSTRERVLSDDELHCVLSYTGTRSDRYKDIVTLLILTGQRRSEIAELRWSEINGNGLILSPTRTKNGREHVVPLGKQARNLLESIEGGSHKVFAQPGSDKAFSGWGRAQRRLLRETGLDHFTLHDLRRTYSTVHAKIGTPIHVTEKLLNHVSGTISGVAAVYNRHSYLEEMRLAVKAHDEYISGLLLNSNVP